MIDQSHGTQTSKKAMNWAFIDYENIGSLGEFDTQALPEVAFEVISNNKGYLPLIAHIKSSGRACKQVKSNSTSVDTQKLIDGLTSKPVEKRPQKVVSLRKHIAAHLKLKGNELVFKVT